MLGFLRKIDKPKIEMAKSQTQLQLSESDLNPEINLYNVRTKILILQKVNSLSDLNNCLDHRYLQKKLNKIRSDELDVIEADLAEKIIGEYESEKKIIKSSRYQYLIDKGKNTMEHLKVIDKQHEKEDNLKQNQKEHKVVTKRMKIILNGLDKKLIDIKKKPKTNFDFLYKNKYPYNNPLGGQIKMKTP